jgi:anti-sigma B factor antagonist
MFEADSADNCGNGLKAWPSHASPTPTGPGSTAVAIDETSIEQRGDLAVLAIQTPMLTNLEADQLLSSLRKYRDQTGCVRFVIDMSNVDFLDSACIGSLVTFLIELDKTNGKLMLAACQPTVSELIKITGLNTHIALVPSVDEANAA